MKLLLYLLLSIFPLVIKAQSVLVDKMAVDAAVTSEMEKQNIVGVAVGIIRDLKLVYSKGYGMAHLRTKTPVTDETIFNWASNSKPLMAIAAMQLAMSQRLDLDAPIQAYLPELPEAWKPITTRQLLCHQSGLPHYFNGQIIPSDVAVPPEDELDPDNCLHRFMKSPLIFKPAQRLTIPPMRMSC